MNISFPVGVNVKSNDLEWLNDRYAQSHQSVCKSCFFQLQPRLIRSCLTTAKTRSLFMLSSAAG